MEEVCLILGSNLGDRAGFLTQALEELKQSGLEVRRASPFLETEPEGVNGEHPPYLNAGVVAETELNPFELLNLTQKIEIKLGRKEKGMRKPRTIDIDVIFYGGKVIVSSELEIPHPGAVKRAFMLKILKKICPDYVHPLYGKRIKDFPLPEKNSGT